MGGGILPVAIYKNQPYFLMSREGIINKEDPGKWSDFGGAKEKGESPRTTAIREGWEESNGFLGTKKDVENLIKHSFVTKINNHGYTTYIVSVNYNKDIIRAFHRDYQHKLKTDPLFVKKHNGFYEKDKVKWMSLKELGENSNKFRRWYRPIVRKIVKFFHE